MFKFSIWSKTSCSSLNPATGVNVASCFLTCPTLLETEPFLVLDVYEPLLVLEVYIYTKHYHRTITVQPHRGSFACLLVLVRLASFPPHFSKGLT